MVGVVMVHQDMDLVVAVPVATELREVMVELVFNYQQHLEILQ